MVVSVLPGWLERREWKAIAYVVEENRCCGVNLVDVACVSRTMIAVDFRVFGNRDSIAHGRQEACGMPQALRRFLDVDRGFDEPNDCSRFLDVLTSLMNALIRRSISSDFADGSVELLPQHTPQALAY